jgi:single-strand DNA-binding protein
MTHVTNHVTLIGNLGDDPKFFGNGDSRGARFDLATNESFGSGDDRRQRTDWHRIVCWGGLTSSAMHLSKGDKIALAGRLRSNDFETKDGNKRRSIEVHAASIEFINVRSLRNARHDSDRASEGASTNRENPAGSEDDIPF